LKKKKRTFPSRVPQLKTTQHPKGGKRHWGKFCAKARREKEKKEKEICELSKLQSPPSGSNTDQGGVWKSSMGNKLAAGKLVRETKKTPEVRVRGWD